MKINYPLLALALNYYLKSSLRMSRKNRWWLLLHFYPLLHTALSVQVLKDLVPSR